MLVLYRIGRAVCKLCGEVVAWVCGGKCISQTLDNENLVKDTKVCLVWHARNFPDGKVVQQ